jgi:hypothetical protein
MELESLILNKVFNHFIDSRDFNGISIEQVINDLSLPKENVLEFIKKLVSDDKLSIQIAVETENPFIIRFGHFDIDVQLRLLNENQDTLICLYPSISYLKENRDTSELNSSPYTKELALGEAHVLPKYFEIDVLERYFSDPRYVFELKDYSGTIGVHSNFHETSLLKEKDEVFIKSFGLGYDKNKKRTIVVFLRYLSDLPPDHQQFWSTKEIKEECKMAEEYFQNMIAGAWTFSHSIFSAFIEEQRVLNKMAIAITGKKLFLNTFEEEKRPKEFTFFLMPTIFNYENFVLLLDKMLSENINRNFFSDDVELTELKSINANLVERINKGSLRLLEEWLRLKYPHPDDTLYNELVGPLKKIRNLRQSPAHKIQSNHYDDTLFSRQVDLMKESFYALHKLRVIFGSHPWAKGIEVANWLKEGKIKMF